MAMLTTARNIVAKTIVVIHRASSRSAFVGNDSTPTGCAEWWAVAVSVKLIRKEQAVLMVS